MLRSLYHPAETQLDRNIWPPAASDLYLGRKCSELRARRGGCRGCGFARCASLLRAMFPRALLERARRFGRSFASLLTGPGCAQRNCLGLFLCCLRSGCGLGMPLLSGAAAHLLGVECASWRASWRASWPGRAAMRRGFAVCGVAVRHWLRVVLAFLRGSGGLAAVYAFALEVTDATFSCWPLERLLLRVWRFVRAVAVIARGLRRRACPWRLLLLTDPCCLIVCFSFLL